jgi:hypothetical protein
MWMMPPEREKRRIGRPTIVEDFRKAVVNILEEKPGLPSLESLRRIREAIVAKTAQLFGRWL